MPKIYHDGLELLFLVPFAVTCLQVISDCRLVVTSPDHFFVPPGKMGLVNCLFRFCSSALECLQINLTLDVIKDCVPHRVPTIY